MREAKWHFTCSFFRRREELKERSSLLEEGTIFQVWLLKRFQWARRSRLLYYFAGTVPKKEYGLCIFLLYGCFIYWHENRGVRPVRSAVRCIKFLHEFRGVYGLVFLLYGAFISCTEFEEGTAELMLYGLLINCTEIGGVYGLLVLYGLWLDSQETVRSDTAGLAQKTKKGVGCFAEHYFSRLCEEVCRWR